MSNLYEAINYEHQFSKMYDARLKELKPYIIKSAEALENIPVLNAILDIKAENHGKECIIIGTLFMVSDLKPSIFDKIDGRSKKIQGIGSKTYYSKEIKYFLEDNSGRIELAFRNIEEVYKKHFVISTGMCVGIVGSLTEKGKFLVGDVLFPFANLDVPMASVEQKKTTGKICFISGPEIDPGNENRARLMVVIDYLRTLGVGEYFVIGSIFTQSSKIDQALLSELDSIFRYTGAKVTLIPNINDFGVKVLPLTPIHPKLFKSQVSSLFNPCKTCIDRKKILITTRFILEDLLRYIPQDIEGIQGGASEYKMHLDETVLDKCLPRSMGDVSSNIINAMATLLKAGHICPTAPDTIVSVPFADKDPFTITEKMDYFCVGGTDKLLSKKAPESNTLLFTVPSFSKRHEVVVLDAENDKLDIVKFDMKGF